MDKTAPSRALSPNALAAMAREYTIPVGVFSMAGGRKTAWEPSGERRIVGVFALMTDRL